MIIFLLLLPQNTIFLKRTFRFLECDFGGHNGCLLLQLVMHECAPSHAKTTTQGSFFAPAILHFYPVAVRGRKEIRTRWKMGIMYIGTSCVLKKYHELALIWALNKSHFNILFRLTCKLYYNIQIN